MEPVSSIPYRRDHRSGGTQSTLLRLVPSGSTVLDLGCSTGYMGSELRRSNCEVYGVDANPLAVEAARSQGYADVRVFDLNHGEGVPFGDRQFDVILAADVLEHLLSPEEMLRRLHAILAPGGTLLVSLPNVAHVSVRLALLRGRFDYRDVGIMDRTHLHFYTFSSARSMLEGTGWRVQRMYCGAALSGNFLNRFPLAATALRGLLSTGIILVASHADS